MRLWKSLIIAYSLSVSAAYAAVCRDVFPDPAATYSASGEIAFQISSKLVGSDGELTFNTIVDNTGGFSCETRPCTSGPASSANLELSSFRVSTSNNDVTIPQSGSGSITAGEYDDINIEASGQLTLNQTNGTYIIDSLNAKLNSTLFLDGGEYWIRRLDLAAGVRLIVTGSEPATIYVNSFSFGQNTQINYNQSAANLVVIAYDSATLAPGSYANGFFYAVNTFQMGLNSRILGAVNTADMRLDPGAMITYAPTELLTADFGSTCTNTVPEPTPIGYWPIDICSVSGVTGEIVDLVAGNNGQALNGASIEFDGKYCQAGSFQGAGDVISIPHSDNYHLSEGAVSLWFKVPDLSFSNRRSAGGMGIFSKDSNGLDNGGHLTFWVLSSGAVRARHQTSSNSSTIQTSRVITEDQWHHLTYTWGANGMRLYIDGVQRASNTGFIASLGNNREPIILGGNAWQTANNSSPSNQLTDLFRGQIDELKLYDQQLSGPQVTSLFNLAEQECTACTTNPELTAHWPLDLCSVNGSAGEVIDIVGNTNGTTVGDAGTINDGKFCQAGRLAGNGAHINIADSSALALSNGAISFWVKTPDLSFTNTAENGGMGLLSRDSLGFDGGGHLTIWLESTGRVRVRHQSNSQSYEVASSTNAIRENTWHLVTYSFGNQRMRLFIDGRLVATNNSFNGGITGNNEPLILGATARVSGNGESTPSQLRDFFKGEFDDVRLYRNELAVADVEALYESSGYVCTNCTGDRPVAFYQFEEQEYTGPGQILDSSANAFDADPIGRVSPILPDVSVSCRALDVPQNFRVDQIDAFNSKLDLNEIGGRGTISFWYRSTNAWIGGNNRQIFDASQLANPPARNNNRDKYFFLVLRNNGSLRFAMEDNRDSDFTADTGAINISANRWVHIAVAWDLVNDTAQIFVNGNSQSVSINSSLRTSQIAGLGDLFFGDIGNTYVIAGGTDNSIYGQLDDVRVYNFNQTRAQVLADINDVTPCASVTKYQIVHPEQALTCSSAAVTIRACANESCSQLSDLPSTVALSPSGWENGDVITFTGSTQVNLARATEGTTTVGLVTAEPSAPVECNPDCTINYVNAGFEIYDRSAPTSTGLPLTIAETDLGQIGIRALQDNNGVCGPLLSGTQTVDLSYDCITTPDANYSPSQCRRPFAGIAVQASGNGESVGEVRLNFNGDGEASLTGYEYADAGRLSISVSAIVEGVTIESGSAQLDSVPARLALTSSAGNPQVAGDEFELSITALGQRNSILPGYNPADLQMSLRRVTPTASSVDGGLAYAEDSLLNSRITNVFTPVSTLVFNDGVYRFSQAYFEEVGSVEWDVRDSVYLGETIDAQSLTLGRFIPAYFDLELTNNGRLADTCSDSFTYIGQPFSYNLGQEPSVRITARNALGNTTENYAQSLWLLTPDIADVDFADSTAYVGNAVVSRSGNVFIDGQDDFDGRADVAILNSEFRYLKQATPTEPFESSIDLTMTEDFLRDSDGVCYQTSYPDGCAEFVVPNITGTQQRYGRLAVENSYGPESQPIFLPLVAEYYVNGEWRLNQQDSCTNINLNSVNDDILVTNASAGEFEQDITSLLSSTSSTGNLVAGMSDQADLVLGPPLNVSGEGVRGSVRVTLNPSTSAPWSEVLNIDWNLDGAIDSSDAPSGIATFGITRGNDRTIHWREVFE